MKSLEQVCTHLAKQMWNDAMNGGHGLCPDIEPIAYAYDIQPSELSKKVGKEFQRIREDYRKKSLGWRP